MNKKIAIFVMTGLLSAQLVAPSFAGEINISKYKATQLALQNNREMLYMMNQLEDEKSEYKLATRTQSAVLDKKFDYDDDANTDRYELSKQKEYYPKKEALDYYNKLVEVEKKKNVLTLESEKLFYQYLNETEAVQNREANVEFMKNKFDVKKKEYEVGKISETELITFEKSYNETYLAYLETYNKQQNLKNDLHVIMGSDSLDDTFNPTKISVPAKELSDKDIKEIGKDLIESSYQLISMEKEKEVKELEKDLKNRYSGYGSQKLELDQLNDSIEELLYRIEDKKNLILQDLYSRHNNILKAENTMEIKNLDYKIATNNYNVSLIKYNNGMISDFDYISSKQAYEDALHDYESAKLSHYIELQSFENFVNENTKVYELK